MNGHPTPTRPRPRPRHAMPDRERSAAPVFVDVTGRRRRLVRHLALIACVLVAAYVGVVGVGLLVGARAPLTPWPGQAEHGPDAGRPSRTAKATRVTPPARATAVPSPRPGTARPAASGSAAAGTAPQPTPTLSHPGNSHATPRANGRTRAPSPKKT
ncbi:MAG TPA: hypothetical protein VF069_25385 [Streptosporangiaceae bacterium]